MAWIAAARPATLLNGPTAKFLRSRSVFMINVAKSAREIGEWEGGGTHHARTQPDARIFFLTQERITLNPLFVAAFIANSEPNTGARPSVRVCVTFVFFFQAGSESAPLAFPVHK
jgi:hypothetical protein